MGYALRPAFEPIIIARKPPEQNTIRNVLAYGVGGINIDGARFADDRWPTNVAFDTSQADALDVLTGTWQGESLSRKFPIFRFEHKPSQAERPRAFGVSHSTVKPLGLMRWLDHPAHPSGRHRAWNRSQVPAPPSRLPSTRGFRVDGCGEGSGVPAVDDLPSRSGALNHLSARMLNTREKEATINNWQVQWRLLSGSLPERYATPRAAVNGILQGRNTPWTQLLLELNRSPTRSQITGSPESRQRSFVLGVIVWSDDTEEDPTVIADRNPVTLARVMAMMIYDMMDDSPAYRRAQQSSWNPIRLRQDWELAGRCRRLVGRVTGGDVPLSVVFVPSDSDDWWGGWHDRMAVNRYLESALLVNVSKLA